MLPGFENLCCRWAPPLLYLLPADGRAGFLDKARNKLSQAAPNKFYRLLADIVGNYRVALEKMKVIFAYLVGGSYQLTDYQH